MAHVDGDGTRPDVRLVVAPSAGTFEPTLAVPDHPHVPSGAEIGRVVGPGRSDPVLSFCDGALVRFLADPGERVRDHQPVAWIEPIDVLTDVPADVLADGSAGLVGPTSA